MSECQDADTKQNGIRSLLQFLRDGKTLTVRNVHVQQRVIQPIRQDAPLASTDATAPTTSWPSPSRIP